MEKEILKSFNPRNCIASKIQKSNRIINNIFRKHLKQFGLSNSQISILFVLSKKKIISQAELGQFLYLEKSTVNRNIKRLIDNKLLFINSNNKIEISEKGINQVISIIPIWENAMEEVSKLLGEKGNNSLDNVLYTLTN